MADAEPIFQPQNAELAGGSQTVDYAPIPYGPFLINYSTRPWFTLLQMQTMLLDQQVWFGLQLRNAVLMQSQVEVVGPSSEVNAFVKEQWDRIWSRFASKIVATKYYGYAGFEVNYRDRNGLEFESLKDFQPRDVRPLVQKGPGTQAGKIAGVGVHGQRISTVGNPGRQPTRLFGMKGLWLNYDALYGSHFGQAATEKSYPPWWDKFMPGGAYDLRRLRGTKDAWLGDRVRYPLGHKFTQPDGTQLSGKDIVREIMELRASGGAMAMPSDRWPNSDKYLFDYEPPLGIADTGIIKQWIDDADWDIFDGLLVPKEVVEAATSGSGFSGRSIPFVMFLAMGDWEFLAYVLAIKTQILEPLVVRRFGIAANDFEIQPIPLIDVMAEKMASEQMGGQVGGSSGDKGPANQNGYRMGSPDGRPQPMRPQQRPEAMQFAVADEPPGTRAKRSAARKGFVQGEELSAEIGRRLESLLKKN